MVDTTFPDVLAALDAVLAQEIEEN